MPVSTCPSLSKEPCPLALPASPNASCMEPIAGTAAFPAAVYLDDVSTDVVAWHWHAEFEIGCVSEGAVSVEIGNRKFTLYQGDIFFINSQAIHTMRNAALGQPAVFKAIVFHGSIVGGAENSIFHQKYVLPLISNTSLNGYVFRSQEPHMEYLFAALTGAWSAFCAESDGYELYLRNTLSDFFKLLLCAYGNGLTVPTDQRLKELRTKSMLHYIHSHFFEPITLSDIAKSASVSVTEALRCFKHVIGVSPIQYLKKFRLKQAAGYLRAGKTSMSQICELCGFANSSYFAKSFKAYYHCTPREYAKQSHFQAF